MKKILILLFVLFISSSLLAQESGNNNYPDDPYLRLKQKESNGLVTITMDSLIIENYKKHLIQNMKTQGIDGYRIRIFSDAGEGAKKKQMQTKAKFISLYPEIKIHDGYDKPYFKLYVGDFRTKRDALKTVSQIREEFPDSFIVTSQIEIE